MVVIVCLNFSFFVALNVGVGLMLIIEVWNPLFYFLISAPILSTELSKDLLLAFFVSFSASLLASETLFSFFCSLVLGYSLIISSIVYLKSYSFLLISNMLTLSSIPNYYMLMRAGLEYFGSSAPALRLERAELLRDLDSCF